MISKVYHIFELLIILLVFSGCKFQNHTSENHFETATIPPATSISPGQVKPAVSPVDQESAIITGSITQSTFPDPDPPLALASIDRQTVFFECINHKPCIPQVNLEGHILIEPYNLGRIYYWNPESVYITLFSNSEVSEKIKIIHSNPQTGEVNSIESPGEVGYTLATIAADRMILARYLGQSLFIIESDLSVTEVDIGVDIHRLIVAGNKIIALNQAPIEMNGQTYVDVSSIDVVSRQVNSERLHLLGLKMLDSRQTPEPNYQYLSHIEGFSVDLENLYCTFLRGDDPRIIRLGAFNVNTPGKVISTHEPVAPFGYDQYRGFLFKSYMGESESGISSGSLYDMSTGRSLLDYDRNPDWRRKKLWIVPFGEYFLLGRSDEIILLSFTGAILERYTLPDRWINQDYNIVRFEN